MQWLWMRPVGAECSGLAERPYYIARQVAPMVHLTGVLDHRGVRTRGRRAKRVCTERWGVELHLRLPCNGGVEGVPGISYGRLNDAGAIVSEVSAPCQVLRTLVR